MNHFTFKNFFIAFVALNILSAFSTSQMVGTFHEVSGPAPRAAPHPVAMHAVDAVSMDIARPAGTGDEGAASPNPALIAHLFPGEALLPAEMPPARAERLSPPAVAVAPHDETGKPLARPAAPEKPRVSDPPNPGWPMLFAVGAMVLYVRYLMNQALQNAAGQAVDVAKQLGKLIDALKSRASGATAKTAAARPMPSQPHAKTQPQKAAAPTARPRSSTVVKPSRWPFAA